MDGVEVHETRGYNSNTVLLERWQENIKPLVLYSSGVSPRDALQELQRELKLLEKGVMMYDALTQKVVLVTALVALYPDDLVQNMKNFWITSSQALRGSNHSKAEGDQKYEFASNYLSIH